MSSSGRVFGLGLSRSGTMSLTHALNLLGYRAIHFPDDERTRVEVMRFLGTEGTLLRLSVLDRFDAATDTPICATFEALDAAYPGSKFVLTIRDKRSWLESCRRYWQAWIEPYVQQPDASARYMKAIHERLYETARFDPERFSRAYDEYHLRVRRHFRDRFTDLLSLDIDTQEKWEPLCAFLNVRRPRVDFPWDRNR
jgi:hypothetical protein